MRVIEQIAAMHGWSERQRLDGHRIAFVPTMGALHEGHLSLVRAAKTRADRVVVSVFVNPSQFTPREDFAAYPRNPARDRQLLEHEAVDILFRPAREAIYPDGYQTHIEVEQLSAPLCGAVRPGHFHGVATIVAKLFNIVRPDIAVFGCKDFQQLQVIRRMVVDLNFTIEVVSHPTVREPDGLAMSSRNAYLGSEERKAASSLFRSLRLAQSLVSRGEREARPIVAAVYAEIDQEPLTHVEYVRLVDSESLQEIERIDRRAVLAVAARIGKARLIDNVMIHP